MRRAVGSASSDSGAYFYHTSITDPYLTVEEMVAMAQGVLKKMQVPGFLAKRFTKDIPNLKRWKSEPASPGPRMRSDGTLAPDRIWFKR
jgi:hypothetical protein